MQPLHTMSTSVKYLDFQTWISAALANPNHYFDGWSEDEIQELRKSENPEMSIYICNQDDNNIGAWYSRYNPNHSDPNSEYVWEGVIFQDVASFNKYMREVS